MARPEVTGKRLVPRAEAAARLGIGLTKFHELVNANVVPVFKIGKKTLVHSDVLDRLIDDPSLLAAHERAA